MSLKKFGPKDIITNTMRTHPSCEFFVVDGKTYYNNIPNTSGTINLGANVVVTAGNVSLYELNVDRLSGSTGRRIGGTAVPNESLAYSLIDTPDGATDPIWVSGEGAVPGGSGGSQYAYSQTAAAGLQRWYPLYGWYTTVADKSTADVSATRTNGGRASIYDSTAPFFTIQPVDIRGDTTVVSFYGTEPTEINIGTAATWDDIIGADTGAGSTQLMSFAVWVRRSTDNGSYARIFQFGDRSNSAGQVWAYASTDGTLVFSAGWSGARGEWETDDAVVPTDTWTHVAITYDATSAANAPIVYINGAAVAVSVNAAPLTAYQGIQADDCYIGSRAGVGTAGHFSWTGHMAQFAIWNVILSAIDVAALYYAKLGVFTVMGGYVASQIWDTGMIYPYVTKDGTRVSLTSVYTGSTYDLDFQYGDVVSASYPLSASITRELIGWYPAGDGGNISVLPNIGPYNADSAGGSRGAGELNTRNPYQLWPSSDSGPAVPSDWPVAWTGEKCGMARLTYDDGTPRENEGFEHIVCNKPKWPHYWALKNALNNRGYLSEHYKVTASIDTGIVYKDQQIINLISIPSIFYGSQIKPGSVSLKWYLTGTLIGELQDSKENGELIQLTGNNPYILDYGADNVAGVVLYKEGFIVLTGSWALNQTDGTPADYGPKDTAAYSKGQITIRSGSGNTPYAPMWIDWGAGANDNCNKLTTSTSGSDTPTGVAASNNFESASFSLSFRGTTETQTLTMFANARRGEANYSNNPTYLIHTSSVTASITTSSYAYIENPDRRVVNFVSSSFADYSASFKRQVYISRVGVYDENKNLIGVATLSNPVRKEEDQDFTFKIKLDI
tara:strand:- start:98 stop:2617 length:2520 start_codon:yes stop_codon:yes gene_type:complete